MTRSDRRGNEVIITGIEEIDGGTDLTTLRLVKADPNQDDFTGC